MELLSESVRPGSPAEDAGLCTRRNVILEVDRRPMPPPRISLSRQSTQIHGKRHAFTGVVEGQHELSHDPP